VIATHFCFSYEVLCERPNTIVVKVGVLNYIDDQNIDMHSAMSVVSLPKSMFIAFTETRIEGSFGERKVLESQQEFIKQMLDGLAEAMLDWFCSENQIDRESLKAWK